MRSSMSDPPTVLGDGMPTEMTWINKFIDGIAKPIINSESFQRLYRVTFLGVLSPRFSSEFSCHPLVSKNRRERPTADDGTRAHHSLSVASVVVGFCNDFSLSESTTKYAAAWALTHDIATWPLSHTGEAAFAKITGTTHKFLRHEMVTGSTEIPGELRLSEQIRSMGLDPNLLVLLFQKSNLPGEEKFKEFRLLHSLIHSAITPDTLEGIHRTGKSIGEDVPDPGTVLRSFDRDNRNLTLFNFNDAVVRRQSSKPILRFWRAKKKIYERYINAKRTIEFESRCSEAIRTKFGSVSLSESLKLTEDDLVQSISSEALPSFDFIARYKTPQKYLLQSRLAKRRLLDRDATIDDLNDILIRD